MPLRWIPLIAVNLAVVTFLLLSYSPHGIGFRPYPIDLNVYRIGSQVWLRGGNLYGVIPATLSGRHLPFTYPPIAAVVLSPLALVPMRVAAGIFALATVGLTALVVRVFILSVSRERPPGVAADAARPGWATGQRAVAWLLPAALLLEPVRMTLLFGQVNVALMALVTADCLARSPRWPRGALTGIAAAVKLTPAAFVLFFLLRRDWRAALTAAVSFLACTSVGFLLAPHDSVQYWTSVVFKPTRPGSPVYAANQSITGVIARTGLKPYSLAGAALWVCLSAVVVAIACLGMQRAFASAQQALALSLNAFAGLLISPISWSHQWVWGEMAVLALAIECCRGRLDRATQAHHRRGLAVPAAGVLVFALAPQWWFPNGGNLELHWAVWEQVVGSSYVIYAIGLLVAAVWVPVQLHLRPAATIRRNDTSVAFDPTDGCRRPERRTPR
jgi:alpha-1,2-mannosyltransferase